MGIKNNKIPLFIVITGDKIVISCVVFFLNSINNNFDIYNINEKDQPDTSKSEDKTPGFELIIIIFALVFLLLLKRRRRS